PKVEQPDVNSVLNEIERSTAQTLSNDPNAVHEQSLLNNSSVSGRPQPALSGTELATSTAIKRPNTFTSKLPGDSAGPNKGHAPGLSDLTSCWRKKVRSGQAQNCVCRTIKFLSTTATCCNRAPSVNCKSWARSSSATRKRHFPWKATLIPSAHLNTILI